MRTLSGQLVMPGATSAAPSLSDIARGLSQLPRFAGQTRRRWSVLEHSLFVAHLLTPAQLQGQHGRLVRLKALMHDAHEVATGDIPTTWKTGEIRHRQQMLDVTIAIRTLGLTGSEIDDYFGKEAKHIVEQVDNRALRAEAWHLIGQNHVTREDFGYPENGDMALLKGMLDTRRDLPVEVREDMNVREWMPWVASILNILTSDRSAK